MHGSLSRAGLSSPCLNKGVFGYGYRWDFCWTETSKAKPGKCFAATDGLSFQQIAADMSGVTREEYAAMMLGGGRSIEGNRSKKDQTRG